MSLTPRQDWFNSDISMFAYLKTKILWDFKNKSYERKQRIF